MAKKKEFRRSKTDRVLAGVLGGLADYMDADPSVVRLVFVLLFVFTGFMPLLLTYIILWAVIPEE